MEDTDKKKSHRDRKSGRKAEKKKVKNVHNQELTNKQKNQKAFSFNSAVQAERRFRRKQDIDTKKQHIPVIDRTALEPPPVIVAVVGPPKVGKTTLIQCLIKNYTKQPLSNISGPVTIVIGKKRRVTLMECNNDINSMIDLAKIADLVLLLVDAAFGFEMEIFEFLNICQVHGMPRIMGVLTHLDLLKNNKQLKNTKKTLKHRFWTEVYQGAKLFYLSGMVHGEYLKNEIKNLSRFISVIKFRPLVWRNTHPYVLTDRLEDITPPDSIRQNVKCDRDICLYGFVRGISMNKENSIHLPGCGDMKIADMNFLPDPCPLPERKKRSLIEKERLIYAPFSGVGGIVYDKDAVYVELAGSHSHTDDKDDSQKEFVEGLLDTQNTIDTKIEKSELKLFSNAKSIVSSEFKDNPEVNENFSEASEDESIASENEDDSDSLHEERVEVDGRVRRRVNFKNDEEVSSGSEDEGIDAESGDSAIDGNETDDEEGEDEDMDLEDYTGNEGEGKNKKRKLSDSDEKYESSAVKWKDNLAQTASDAFVERQNSSQNIWKLVYGSRKKDQEIEEEEDYAENIGGIFKVLHEKEKNKLGERETLNEEDSSVFPLSVVRDWTKDEFKMLIRDCFVTGSWKKSEDAEELLKLDDMSDEEYDDFEDLETGEKHVAEKTNEGENKQELIERKKKLKEKFDAEYDGDKEHTYYDDLKAEADQQAQMNRSEFEGLPDDLRIELEGYRPGMYVRIEVRKVPYELINNFDPTYPLIVGGLLPSEENIGFVQVRLKRHRWYHKTLKNRDPLIISLGWRRFQTIPVFSKLEDNMRQRMLKYTPAHVSCMAQFYGPLTPQSTGFLAIQNIAVKSVNFRIAATGAVVELDQSVQIMKKLKLVGTPLKIYKKTAFIKGMFNSVLEVGKFEGGRIKTVSGIRGQIKKAVNKPEGAFRATFEDKIKLSDIVFCRTWYQVSVPKFYNPVTSLLLPTTEKTKWSGMRTVGELKHDFGIKRPAENDSLYTPIIRKEKTFKPLIIPRTLQKSLPYKDKPKMPGVNKKQELEAKRIAVIRDPYEQKVTDFMKMIKTNFTHKKEQERQVMIKRVEQHKKILEATDLKKLKRQKELKKQVFRAISKMSKKNVKSR